MEGVLFVVDLRHMTIGDTIVGCWTVSFIKKNDSEESLEIYTIGFRSCVGRGSSVGRGAERGHLRYSIW